MNTGKELRKRNIYSQQYRKSIVAAKSWNDVGLAKMPGNA